MATILDERTEEEIEKYRQERINQFVWLMKNIDDVRNAIRTTNDPDRLCPILLKKLKAELREFLRE